MFKPHKGGTWFCDGCGFEVEDSGPPRLPRGWKSETTTYTAMGEECSDTKHLCPGCKDNG